jgi:phosphoribosylformylglycinamidine synthase
VIGEVTNHGELRCYFEAEIVGAIPARLLTEETPRYEVEQKAHSTTNTTPDPINDESKEWIYEQYDQLVGSRTVRRPGFDGAVLRIDGIRGIAVSLDGPPIGERDPYRAGWSAVMESAMNVACVGGEPLALTDCLNFGNPERPEIGWELARAIDGITDAANELGIPVVSGNVSLYNETGGRPIPPTPVVGCVGLVPDVTRLSRGWRKGDRVYFVHGEGAELVRFAYEAARRGAFVTDSSVAEAAHWSGVQAGFGEPAGPGILVALLGALSGAEFVEELGTL